MEIIQENTERLVTPEDIIEVDHELAARLIGGRAMEMYALPQSS